MRTMSRRTCVQTSDKEGKELMEGNVEFGDESTAVTGRGRPGVDKGGKSAGGVGGYLCRPIHSPP